MRAGKQYPLISQNDVRAALEDLLYSSKPRTPNPLHFLLLIDLELLHSDLPISNLRREFTLDNFLIRLITEEYQYLRLAYCLPPLPSDLSRSMALSVIQLDLQTESVELIGWSLLYYRYVAIHLHMSQIILSHIINVDDRTLRRYLNHAFRRLLEKITDLERIARDNHRRLILYSKIPGLANTRLIGREAIQSKVIFMLQANSPCHIQITGASGVGKTVFVESVVKTLIDSGATDHLIWISHPKTLLDIQYSLNEQLLEEGSPASLRDIFMLERVTIVIDGIDNIQFYTLNVRSFIERNLLGATVLFVTRMWLDFPGAYTFLLPELAYSDAVLLMQDTAEKGEQCLSSTLLDSIWVQVGGNPRAIRTMVRHISFFGHAYVSICNVNQIYADICSSLHVELKQAWFAFLLCPTSGVHITTLCTIWPNKVTKTKVETLLTHHLIVQSSENGEEYFISSSVRAFLREMYLQDVDVQLYIDELIGDLKHNRDSSTIDLDIIEHILLSDCLNLADPVRDFWISSYWQQGVELGHYTCWHNLLAPYQKLHYHWPLKIGYSICLRRLGEFEQALHVLEAVIGETGGVGAFLEQSTALIELGVLFRLQAHFNRAMLILDQAERTICRLQGSENTQIMQKLSIEKAQILLLMRDDIAAEEIITKLPHSSNSIILQSELYFMRGDVARLETLARSVILEFSHHNYLLSRFYTILGQAYRHNGDLEQARIFLRLALVLATRNHTDSIGLAQAQSNLGALLIDLHEFDEAEYLLELARKIQERFRNRVALFATHHNISLLNTLIVH
ncbi:MAG: tetratricopeptide repeat protein [Anaerolineae bacterium]|nr:tetratricopeptide repeat protein [Anaerolineae bacterium]